MKGKLLKERLRSESLRPTSVIVFRNLLRQISEATSGRPAEAEPAS